MIETVDCFLYLMFSDQCEPDPGGLLAEDKGRERERERERERGVGSVLYSRCIGESLMMMIRYENSWKLSSEKTCIFQTNTS